MAWPSLLHMLTAHSAPIPILLLVREHNGIPSCTYVHRYIKAATEWSFFFLLCQQRAGQWLWLYTTMIANWPLTCTRAWTSKATKVSCIYCSYFTPCPATRLHVRPFPHGLQMHIVYALKVGWLPLAPDQLCKLVVKSCVATTKWFQHIAIATHSASANQLAMQLQALAS